VVFVADQNILFNGYLIYMQELIRWSVKNRFLPAGARIDGQAAAAKVN